MLTRKQIAEAIKCEDWQRTRLAMKKTSTQAKLETCRTYLEIDRYCCDRNRQRAQVENYLNALSRGGIIKPSDTIVSDLKQGRIVIVK